VTTLVVHPAKKPLAGSVPVPSDKSVGHRALLFAAIAKGKSRITGFSYGEDNLSTAGALRAMGVTITDVSKGEVHVDGVGLFGLKEPKGPLDCGNSGTTMRMLAGLLVAQPFETVLIGDASLTRRPMLRIATPLRQRGGRVEGATHPTKAGDITPPLRLGPLPDGKELTGLEYDSPVASAQVKSAVLLSGLYAHGTTYLREPQISRDHTERMLSAMGAPLRCTGNLVELDPAGWSGDLAALDIELPGDISAAAFLLAAGMVVPGSQLTVRSVGTNPTRTGFLEIARDMGAGLIIEPKGDRGGEPLADLHASSGNLRGGRVGGELVPRAVDEIPILCALAARANGVTEIRDAEELRVKESDRIATMAHVLSAFGVTCEELPDGMRITGTQAPLRAASVESKGDHRIAMTAVVLGLLGDGPSTVRDCDCIGTSFPRFVGTLRALGAEIETA
jgi:3-phosphoshikimate 1-carboxyvinyltransferase